MNGKKSLTKSLKSKKVSQLHYDTRNWLSKLRFMQDEIVFIDRLLHSYVFEPNTRALFERIHDYRQRITKLKCGNVMVIRTTIDHENQLGGMLECSDATGDAFLLRKHEALKAEVVDCLATFQDLKSEIFNYAGGILKKRKP